MAIEKKKISFSLIYFLIAISAILVLQRYFLAREVVTISYSEFKVLLSEKLVEIIEGEELKRLLENGKSTA
jgi:hypothetical protein